MAQPYNYMLDIPNPMESINQGLATGFNMAAKVDQVQQQREQLALQKQEQARYQKDMGNLIENQTDENFTKTQLLHPAQAEAIQKVWDRKNQAEKDAAWSIGSQALMAVNNKQPLIAKQFFDDAALGFENANKKQSAGAMRFLSSMIEKNSDNAGKFLQEFLSTVDRDKFDKTFSTFREQDRADEMQPIEIAQKQAQTNKTIAETNDIPLAAEDRRTGVDNQGRKIEYDNQYNYDKLSQDQQQFYDNLSQQEKLEANKLRASKNETATQRTERLEKVNGFSSAASNAASTAKLASELINDYKKLSDSTGAGYWNAAMRSVPGTAEYNFAKRVETLKSQAFMIGAQNLRGLGAMTEAEGKKVTDALGNLDLSQSTDQVAKQLAMIAQSANNVAKTANRNAQIYATKGQGYSQGIKEAAKQLGISQAEAQKFANENGL